MVLNHIQGMVAGEFRDQPQYFSQGIYSRLKKSRLAHSSSRAKPTINMQCKQYHKYHLGGKD